MRKKKGYSGWIILITLILLISVTVYFVYQHFKTTSTSSSSSTETITQVQATKTTITNSVSTTSGITSSLTENLQLHATYYLKQVLVEKNQYVAAGDNILEYTNGKYLTAPYNCVITAISVPDVDGECSSKNYITVESTDNLSMSLTVSEDNLSKISVGQEAEIVADILPDKTYTGNVTSISNTGTYSSDGSTFTVTVEFQNDGKLSIGMTAKCDVILEKAENVLAVPTESVTTQNGKKYVNVMNSDGKTYNKVEVETGISNNAYTEIKSGIDENTTVAIITTSSSSKTRSFKSSGQMGGMESGSQSFSGGEMPSGVEQGGPGGTGTSAASGTSSGSSK